MRSAIGLPWLRLAARRLARQLRCALCGAVQFNATHRKQRSGPGPHRPFMLTACRYRSGTWCVSAAPVDRCYRPLSVDLAGPASPLKFICLLCGAPCAHWAHCRLRCTSQRGAMAARRQKNARPAKPACTLDGAATRFSADDSRTGRRRAFARQASRRPAPVLR